MGGGCTGSPPARGRGCLPSRGVPPTSRWLIRPSCGPAAGAPASLVPPGRRDILAQVLGPRRRREARWEPSLLGSLGSILYSAAAGRSPLALPSFSLVLNGEPEPGGLPTVTERLPPRAIFSGKILLTAEAQLWIQWRAHRESNPHLVVATPPKHAGSLGALAASRPLHFSPRGPGPWPRPWGKLTVDPVPAGERTRFLFLSRLFPGVENDSVYILRREVWGQGRGTGWKKRNFL